MFCGRRRGFKKKKQWRASLIVLGPDAVFLTPAWRLSIASFFFFDQLPLISRWLQTLWRSNSFVKPAQPAAQSPGSRGAAISSK